jgi:hypothetical protein
MLMRRNLKITLIKKEGTIYKKLISGILVVALLNLLGCYSSELIKGPELEQTKDDIKVKTKDGKEYQFSESNFYVENDTLRGRAPIVKIALSNIESIEVEPFNLLNTLLLSGGIVFILASALFIIYAIGMSKMD